MAALCSFLKTEIDMETTCKNISNNRQSIKHMWNRYNSGHSSHKHLKTVYN